MSDNASKDPMLDLFVFETLQLVEQLEQSILNSEKSNGIESSINEIFRIMHTIKGSAAMMTFNDISSLAHSLEDLFFYIRENNPKNIDYSKITDLVLEFIDFIKAEIEKIEYCQSCDGNSSKLTEEIKDYLNTLKAFNSSNISSDKTQHKTSCEINLSANLKQSSYENNLNSYTAHIFFDDGSGMENLRAFEIINNLNEIACSIQHTPEELFNDDKSTELIINEGFKISFKSDKSFDELHAMLSETILLKSLKLDLIIDEHMNSCQSQNVSNHQNQITNDTINNTPQAKITKEDSTASSHQKFISVNVSKLDSLLDIVGEIVISQALVTQHPELSGVLLNDFYKAARQLQKNTNELQDIVMSIRMVALASTFQKMNRLVRDMSKKLNKEVKLKIMGEETEVDKNIIEHISDPLMHLIRNSIDHGIEPIDERIANDKPKVGTITLEAKNAGGEVWITVKDDGRGLNRDKILKKAKDNGLLDKPETELTDKEIYSFIFHPGFSTKDGVTEFSGRGVGMDVVSKNIEYIRGTVSVDSTSGLGTVVTIKIPLTLAIIDGMNIQVGNSKYTIPITSIKESFRANNEDVVTDTSGSEMILLRGQCFPIVKLHEFYNIDTKITEYNNGIIVLVENDCQSICLFADALLGEQQVVVKSLPNYIKKVKGIAGCTLLGNGDVSLILDIPALFSTIL